MICLPEIGFAFEEYPLSPGKVSKYLVAKNRMYPKGRKYCTVWVQAPGTIPSNGLVFIVFLNKDALPEFIEGKNNEHCRISATREHKWIMVTYPTIW
jgi:hypothetical protein